jgi:hypothetical protein
MLVDEGEAGRAWMACGRHPSPSCGDVMTRAPQPLVTSSDVYFKDQLRTAKEQQEAGKPIESWRQTMFRAVCSRDRQSLRSLCTVVKLQPVGEVDPIFRTTC